MCSMLCRRLASTGEKKNYLLVTDQGGTIVSDVGKLT